MKLFGIDGQPFRKLISHLPIRWLFTITVLVQTSLTVGSVTYLSHKNGEAVVTNLVDQLMLTTTERIRYRLQTHLQIPQGIIKMNRHGMENGYLTPDNWEQLRLHFFQQLRAYQFPTSIYFGSANGVYVFSAQDRKGVFAPPGSFLSGGVRPSHIGTRYYYIVNEQGKLIRNIPQQTKPYAPVNRPWFQTAKLADKQTWTAVYPYFYIPVTAIAAVAPVYRQGEFIGVVGCDLVLEDISYMLKEIKISPDGEIFIMDSSGNLVAMSTEEQPFVTHIRGRGLIRLAAVNSRNKLVAGAAREIKNRWHNLQVPDKTSFKFADETGEEHFVNVSSYRDDYGLNWSIVLVVPQSDFTEEIDANIQRTLIIVVIILYLSVSLGIAMGNWLTQPILNLNLAAKVLSFEGATAHDLELDKLLYRRDELGELAQSFVDMAQKLQISFDDIKQALEHSEDKFAKIFRSCPDSMIINDLKDGKFLYVNEAFCTYSGYSPAEVIGRNTLELGIAANPIEMANFNQELDKQKYIRNFEVNWLRKDGKLRTSWVSSEIVTIDGNSCLVSICKDITDWAAAQVALKESEAKFRSAFEDANIGMALVDITGNFIRVNAALCQQLGYDQGELLTLNIIDTTYRDDLQICLEIGAKCLAGDITHYNVEKRLVTKEGNIIFVLLNSSLVRDEDNQPLYFISQIQDITERLKIEQMKNEFIGVVSHELRTPLTVITGALGIVNSGVLDGEISEIKKLVGMAGKNSDRLLRIVNDILILQRWETGKKELNLKLLNVHKLGTMSVELVQPMADNYQLIILSTLPSISIFVDEEGFIKTLTNLLTNAIKFSYADGKVELSAKVSEAEITFVVRDEGRGIPKDKLEAIFGRFEQVDVSDARQKGGTGLGLAICKSIVEQHGGRIWVESVLGAGSTFYFTLPMRSDEKDIINR